MPITFSLTEEQRLLKESVASFLTNSDGRPRSTIWRGLATDLGLFGALLPEEEGGFGGGPIDAMAVMEEIGRGLVVGPVIETLVMAPGVVRQLPGEWSEELARSLVTGGAICAWAHGEYGSRYQPYAVETRARLDGDGYRIDGEKVIVAAGPDATHLFLVARTSGNVRDRNGLSLFLVQPDTPGISMRSYRGIDSSDLADIRFDDVRLPRSALLGSEGEAAPIIDVVLALASAAACAEAAGLLRHMVELTAEHVRTRVQFGRPLAMFQALRHHLVDAWVYAEQAYSVAFMAADAVTAGTDQRILSAAWAFLGKAFETVGRYAIQFHGGMGITDEAPVSHYFRRMLALEARFGATAGHIDRYVSLSWEPAERHGELNEIGASANLTQKEIVFRDEVRAFLGQRFSADLKARVDGQAGFLVDPGLFRDWQAILAEKGWDAPHWPIEHGGTGWSPTERYIFYSECAAVGAPFGSGQGLSLCGPVIMRYGTEAQKAFFLPRIRSGEQYWAQGFSEPGAGSDLAALQLRATRNDDDYVLNGSKIWTTHAQYADWIFLLCRTSIGDRKQDGISFLLSPLHAPGITIRPILSMSGEHEVNQVFFEDARVPATYLVGEEGQGWEIARYLLNFERGGRPFAAGLWQKIERIRQASELESDGHGRRMSQDASFRRALADLEIDTLAADWTERRIRLAPSSGAAISVADASMMKLLVSERTQHVQKMMVDLIGPYALVDQRDALEPNARRPVIGPAHGLTATARYLNGRAYTIFGGASEVQRDILARAALNL